MSPFLPLPRGERIGQRLRGRVHAKVSSGVHGTPGLIGNPRIAAVVAGGEVGRVKRMAALPELVDVVNARCHGVPGVAGPLVADRPVAAIAERSVGLSSRQAGSAGTAESGAFATGCSAEGLADVEHAASPPDHSVTPGVRRSL